MIFIVEVIVFSVYNFYNNDKGFKHHLYRFSLFIAILYFILYVLLLLWNYKISCSKGIEVKNEDWKLRWCFIYEGLE